jgi:hypothetical protein
MSNYTKSTNFAAKDSLSHGNAAKIVKGTEINTEFDNIATAIASKADGDFTVFGFVETAGVLYIQSSGTSVAKIDGSGNLTVIGNVISNGTM